MSTSLSDTTIHLVKATVPALQEHGLAITKRMYERMFQNEEIRDLFNQSHHGETGSQPKALATAVLAYAQNIDNIGALAPAVERIAQKHVGSTSSPSTIHTWPRLCSVRSRMCSAMPRATKFWPPGARRTGSWLMC
jgi:nitric oxide dioxygenase